MGLAGVLLLLGVERVPLAANCCEATGQTWGCVFVCMETGWNGNVERLKGRTDGLMQPIECVHALVDVQSGHLDARTWRFPWV